jgi:P4 family phage/plasmid primase-like protien
MTQVAHQTTDRLTTQIQQAIEQQDANALYALAPRLAHLTLADLAPLLTSIQRGMLRPSGFSIRMLHTLIREANVSHVGGRHSSQDQATSPTENIRSIENYVSFSDRGNAMRLLNLHGQSLRYCHAWKQWLIYDGGRWIVDETAAIVRRCESVIQSLYEEASHSEDPKERKSLASWALHTESFKAVGGMLSWASARPGVPVLPDELDSDQWRFNVKNGTINLKTGQLQAHQREDLITKQAPVTFDTNAECPQWLSFLDRIMDGNQGLIEFLQRGVGYSLTGSRKEHGFFIPFGRGRNGKSTFIDKIMDLLGDYAESTPTSTFMASKNDSVPADIARLKGVRFVSSQEAEKGRHLAESLVKQITGDKRISARFMHQNWFTFEPICKVWLSTNYKPIIRGTDDGIWRRIHLIPFNVQIPESEVDADLPEKLQAELPGILNWAIQGCLAWQVQGLNPPEEVRAATDDYRADQDTLRTFFTEHCFTRANAHAPLQTLYTTYANWCEESGEKQANIMTKHQFNGYLKERGYAQGRNGRVRYWVGIGILSTDTPTDEPEPEQQTWEPTPETHSSPVEPIQPDQPVPGPDSEHSTVQPETSASPPPEPIQDDRPAPPHYCTTCNGIHFRWSIYFGWQCISCSP